MKRWTNGLPSATTRLGAKMALRGLAASQPGCARIPMMVRSKRCSTKRPDTLMQLSRSSLSEIRLAPRGRAIHLARLCRNRSGRECLLCPGSLDINNRTPKRALQMESYPKFHNEVGVPIVRIGCREFKCIGDKPPQDHPHIYLNMGDASEILCPYCSTLFCFDPSLGVHEADPADCAYGDID
jgi:uncharacterized Zn-finger protein